MPATRNFTIWIGNTGTEENPAGIVLVYKSGSVPVDLTGAVVVFFAATSPAIRKTSADSGPISIDGPAGRITIPLTVADTRTWKPGQAVAYEIELRLGGNQTTILTGTIFARGGLNDDS